MTHEKFSEMLSRRLERTRQTLSKKSNEYASPKDKLHNFKMAAHMRPGRIPTDSLQGMLDKHLVAYFDMLDGVRQGYTYTQEQIDERFGDIICYFICQEALFSDHNDDMKDPVEEHKRKPYQKRK